jgi:hydrogenase expression/formation protein HypC
MCLGVPGKVIEINVKDNWAVIEAFGVKSKICTPLIEEEIAVGDYLMVHAGYAIGKIDNEEADKTLKLLEEFAQIDV